MKLRLADDQEPKIAAFRFQIQAKRGAKMTQNALADLMGAAVTETLYNGTPKTHYDDAPTSGDAVQVPAVVTVSSSAKPTAVETPLSGLKNLGRAPPVPKATPDDDVLDLSGLGMEIAAESAAPPQEEVDDFADEEPELPIGSAAIGGDSDDEFDLGGGAASDAPAYGKAASVAAAPARYDDSSAVKADAAAAAATRAAAAAERDRRALAAAVAEAAARAEADEAAAAGEAAEVAAAAARERQEAMRLALASVASGGADTKNGAMQTPEAKSRAEQADETAAAAIGKISDAVIEEDEEEELEEEEEEEEEGGDEAVESGGDTVGEPAESVAEPQKPSGAEIMSAMLMAQFDAATAQADSSRLANGKGAEAQGADPRFVPVRDQNISSILYLVICSYMGIIYVYIYIHIYIYTYTHVYIYIHIYFIYMYMRVYTHVYACVHMYEYIYLYISIYHSLHTNSKVYMWYQHPFLTRPHPRAPARSYRRVTSHMQPRTRTSHTPI